MRAEILLDEDHASHVRDYAAKLNEPGAGPNVFRDGNDQAARQRRGYPAGAFRSDPQPYAGTE